MSSIDASVPADSLSQTAPESVAFFPVSLAKLSVMSLCTFGLYEIYWAYKNWQLIKAREPTKLSPPLRSLFGVIFCYSLFRRVEEKAESLYISFPPAGLLAAGWIIVTLLYRLPDPYWLVSLFAFAFLLPVQNAANEINARICPKHDSNSRFSALNIVGIVFGSLFIALVIYGLFFIRPAV